MAKTTDDPVHHLRNYPYQDGTVLQLDYYPEDHPNSTNKNNGSPSRTVGTRRPVSLSVKIVKTLSKTFSCVLLVELMSSSTSRVASSLSRRRSVLNYHNFTSNSNSNNKLTLSNASQYVLKLCDRRFAQGLRDDYDAGEWNPDIEDSYVRFEGIPEDRKPEIRVADDFEGDSWYDEEDEDEEDEDEDRDRWAEETASSDEDDEDEEEWKEDIQVQVKPHKRHMSTRKIANQNWTTGHREAYLQKWCDKLQTQELEVYRALSEVQGSLVPILYGPISVRDKARLSCGTRPVQGLLIEFKKDSFALRDIPTRVPNRDGVWGEIGKKAVKLVQDVGDLGVLNRDIRLDNILVVPCEGEAEEHREKFAGSPNGSWELIPSLRELERQEEEKKTSYKVVMIDFGIARVQGEYESNEEFRKARRMQDEEGAIGYVLEQYLMRHAGGGVKPFKFNHSRRLDRPWDEDETEI